MNTENICGNQTTVILLTIIFIFKKKTNHYENKIMLTIVLDFLF